MKISKHSDFLVLKGDKSTVVVGDSYKCKSTDADVFLGSNINFSGEKKNKLIIDSPGEYEFKEVMVKAIAIPATSKVMMFSIDLDEINIVYVLDIESNLTNNVIDQLGVNNILILDIGEDMDVLRHAIDEIDPNILVFKSNSKDLVEKLTNKLSIASIEETKSLNVSYSDFDINDDKKTIKVVNLV